MTVSVPKVLVVDDNHHIRSMLMKALVHYGYQVTVAKDGYSGIENLKKQKFDVILLDLQLPDITGHGFLRATSTSPERPPVIMISGESDQGDVIKAFHAHVADFILKPFTVLEVVAALDKVLKRGANAPAAHADSKYESGGGQGESVESIPPPKIEAQSIIEFVKAGKLKLPRPDPFMEYMAEMFEQSDMDTNSLVKLLQLDKDCASQIIHAALSKRHGGLHQALVDLPSAVKLLGTKRTLQILRVFIIKMTLLAPVEIIPNTFQPMWNNTMATASVARILAENFAKEVSPDRMYVLAFIHNIGELLMVYLATVSAMKGEPVPDHDQIAQCVMDSHCELGHTLAREWELGDEICEIIHRHHDESLYSDNEPDERLKRICAMLQLAYHLTIARDGKYLPFHPKFPDRNRCLEILGIGEAQLPDLVSSTAPAVLVQQ